MFFCCCFFFFFFCFVFGCCFFVVFYEAAVFLRFSGTACVYISNEQAEYILIKQQCVYILMGHRVFNSRGVAVCLISYKAGYVYILLEEQCVILSRSSVCL